MLFKYVSINIRRVIRFRILNLHKGQLTVKELQGEFHHPIFAVSPILKCLILKGLVKKERCELDERRVIVTIKREKL